jgi:hypothetical protein
MMLKKPTVFKPKASQSESSIPAPMPLTDEDKLMGSMSLFIPYEEVFGEPATINQLTALLSQLNIHNVLRCITIMNNLNVPAPGQTLEQIRRCQVFAGQQILSPAIREKLLVSSFTSNIRTAIFHRQQQLYLLTKALTRCQHNGGLPWEEKAWHIFGEACLVANSLIGTTKELSESPIDGYVNLAHILCPLIDLSADHEPSSLIGRAHQLWIDIPQMPQLKREKNYIDFASTFQKAYQIDLKTVLNILYMVAARVLVENDTNPNAPHSRFAIDLKKAFEKTPYDLNTIRKVMSLISLPLAKFSAYIDETPTQSPKHDFSALQKYPGIEVEDDIYLIYDRAMLLKFFTTGIWFKILEALPEEKQKDFKAFFGIVYATYIERLLAHVCNDTSAQKKHRLVIRPMFDKSAEVCDALVVSGDVWVMIETKASILPTRSKFLEDPGPFKKELDDRFFGNPKDKGPKGVCQLAISIRKLNMGAAIVNTDLDFRKVKNVYPVIVSYDIALCATMS